MSTKTTSDLRQARMGRILSEIQRRHNLMLDKFTGELCTVYFRLLTGEDCSCKRFLSDGATLDGTFNFCSECYNVGFVGGYTKQEDVLIRLRSASGGFEYSVEGYKVIIPQVAWVAEEPVFHIGDFFVRENGDRFAVSNVRSRETQGVVTFQQLSLQNIEPNHQLYQINF